MSNLVRTFIAFKNRDFFLRLMINIICFELEGFQWKSGVYACWVMPDSLDSMGCSPLGSSVRQILQARVLEWAARALLQGIYPTQRWNPHLFMSTCIDRGWFFTTKERTNHFTTVGRTNKREANTLYNGEEKILGSGNSRTKQQP